jgi:hypothetical protein
VLQDLENETLDNVFAKMPLKTISSGYFMNTRSIILMMFFIDSDEISFISIYNNQSYILLNTYLNNKRKFNNSSICIMFVNKYLI